MKWHKKQSDMTFHFHQSKGSRVTPRTMETLLPHIYDIKYQDG